MSCLYLVVRYLGLSLAITWGCWGGMFYIPESPCKYNSCFQNNAITLPCNRLRHSCCTRMGCVYIFLLCGR
ncbi:hypothetical protein BD769DRAFT_1436322 [Suillus cothurnatus]|nr:hypothetical protein BD769DRAFT_1436322 [Suillus cothurnatus]